MEMCSLATLRKFWIWLKQLGDLWLSHRKYTVWKNLVVITKLLNIHFEICVVG